MNKTSPNVSVVMAVYNTPPSYLDRAVESILAQTKADFEFVIVDDGSNATTRSRLYEYALRDNRIVLHVLPTNVGLTHALNIGLTLVQGKFIARQDADDISHPQRLENSLNFLARNLDLDAVGTHVCLIDAKGSPQSLLQINPDPAALNRRNQLVHGSMMFRRRVFELVEGYNEKMRMSQDYELYLRMHRKFGMRIGVVPEVLYFLRQHADSLSSRKVFKQLYYSVLAKSETLPYQVSPLCQQLYFAVRLAYDLVFTHHLLLGPLLRRCLRR